MQSLYRLTSAILSLSLCCATLPKYALAASPSGDRTTLQTTEKAPLTPDQRILHALNRFTFGPRPGDLEAVRAMGLNRWFQQQLHPSEIDDSALDARLAKYPAMQLSTEALMARLPANPLLRQIIRNKAQMPDGGSIEHQIYTNQIERIRFRKQKQEAKAQNAAPNMAPGMMAGPANKMADSGSMMMAPSFTEQPEITPSLVRTTLSLPPQDRLQALAAMPQPQFDAFLKALRGRQRADLLNGMSPEIKEEVGALESPERTVVNELLSTRLTRDIYSEAQLQEVMTDFWLNHFNIYLHKNEEMPYYLVSYQRDTIRPHALGKFEDLLEAVAHSPAMLLYLDNWTSTGPDSIAAQRAELRALRRGNRHANPESINENYGRELMELHTLSVNGGYTQADVIQAARILTGWTIDKPQFGGGFEFNANRHEPGTEKVMGKKFKASGEKQGEQFLHFLATRPATARFLSRELAIRFVSDNPPQSLVNRMTKSYLKSGGDISKVLETLYRSPEFWSPKAYQAKIKTPLEYVVSAVRASNANITNMQPLLYSLNRMGMPLYGCIPPTGYKWEADDWVSTGALVDRMNFALALATNRLNGITTEWAPSQSASAIAPENAAPQSEEARLEAQLIPGGVSETTRSAVLQQFTAQAVRQPFQPARDEMGKRMRAGGKSVVAAPSVFRPQPNHLPPPRRIERQDQLLAGLLIGSPEFQRR